MLKKIFLAIIVLALLASVGMVFAQEEDAGGNGRQMRRGQARRVEQDSPADTGRKGVGPMKQRQGALAAGLDRWLGELTEAYRLKDEERMGQLLRRMNQARQKVQQRRQQSDRVERDFRRDQGTGRGRMRIGKAGQAGPRVGRIERFIPPMRGRDPVGRPRHRGGIQRLGRRHGGAIGRPWRGMCRGGQGFRQGERRMSRFREHTGEYFGEIGRRAWRER